MAKWADHIITCVDYTAAGDHISIVGVYDHDDVNSKLTNYQTWHRAQVVKALGNGETFVTSTKNAKGEFTKGASVGPVKKGEEVFIRTDANATAADNLGSLPGC